MPYPILRRCRNPVRSDHLPSCHDYSALIFIRLDPLDCPVPPCTLYRAEPPERHLHMHLHAQKRECSKRDSIPDLWNTQPCIANAAHSVFRYPRYNSTPKLKLKTKSLKTWGSNEIDVHCDNIIII